MPNIKAYIKLNCNLDISLASGLNSYSSRVEKITDDAIEISRPAMYGWQMPVSKNTKVCISMCTNVGRFSFNSHIMDVSEDTLTIATPDTFKHMQLREYFRVPVYKYIKIFTSTQAGHINAYLKDLSGGGCCLIVDIGKYKKETKKVLLDCGDILKDLPFLEMSVTRIKQDGNKYHIAGTFINIKETDRDKIIRYVMSRQLELRDIEQ